MNHLRERRRGDERAPDDDQQRPSVVVAGHGDGRQRDADNAECSELPADAEEIADPRREAGRGEHEENDRDADSGAGEPLQTAALEVRTQQDDGRREQRREEREPVLQEDDAEHPQTVRVRPGEERLGFADCSLCCTRTKSDETKQIRLHHTPEAR